MKQKFWLVLVVFCILVVAVVTLSRGNQKVAAPPKVQLTPEQIAERAAYKKKLQLDAIKKAGNVETISVGTKRGEVWIGMDRSQIIWSFGQPTTINKSVGSYGTKEQFVYREAEVYIYVEDGFVTSWQTSQ